MMIVRADTGYFTAAPLSGVTPLTVTFTNTSTGATSYQWAFGDGATSTAVSPTHTYTQSGTYTVSLIATGLGGSNTLTRTNYLNVYQPVVAGFTAAPLSGVSPLTVTFTNTSTGATSYQWDFGDSTSSTAISPTHVYTQSGVYTVSLIATGLGGSNTLTRTNYISVTDSLPITGAVVIAYTYDPLYRLTGATYSTGESFQYQYDAVGNRTVQTATITSTQVTNYVYDAANRLTSVNGQTYTWDNNGNLLNDGSATYLYDRANRMISTTLGGVTTQFNYNGDGARLKQIVNGVVTTYTQDLAAPLPAVLEAKTGVTTTKYLYSLGTRPLAQNGTAWEYLLPDALGSVRQIADASGNVTLAESYEPYGSVLTSSGTASSIFAYAGEQADTTGLIYLRARYMQPRLGIFLARDPASGDVMRPGSMNGWVYVEGQPINRVDPSGLFSALTWARSAGFTADIPGVSQWLSNLYPHWGWAKMLLDADEGDFAYLWGRTPPWDISPYGRFYCENGKAHIHIEPNTYRGNENRGDFVPLPGWYRGSDAGDDAGGLATAWRYQVGATLLSSKTGTRTDYRDGGNEGNIIDLPDFVVLAGVDLPVKISLPIIGPTPLSALSPAIFDRYGNFYSTASAGGGAIAGLNIYAEGYITNWGGEIYHTEEELKNAIMGLTLSISGGAGGKIESSIGLGTESVTYSGFYIGVGLGAAINLTVNPFALKDPRLSWDWMFHVHRPSLGSVWNDIVWDFHNNPCGECTPP